MKIQRVISGGQTGVDRAALFAAKTLGIPTGGYMTKGYRTLKGPRPEYVHLFGVETVKSPLYVTRTRKNVQISDGTLRIAMDFETVGELCTMKAIKQFNKPHFDVGADELSFYKSDLLLNDVLNWLNHYSISILNVAGNSHEHWSDAFKASYRFLNSLFERTLNYG